MDVNRSMEALQELLNVTAPILIRSGIDPGGEDWDQFTEMVFDMLVGRSLDELRGYPSRWRYGFWSRPGNEQPPAILASLKMPGTILVGEFKSPNSSTLVQYSELDWLDGTPIAFAFREFSHPFLQVGSPEALEYVLGEVVDEGQPVKFRTRICAPFKMCRFYLE